MIIFVRLHFILLCTRSIILNYNNIFFFFKTNGPNTILPTSAFQRWKFLFVVTFWQNLEIIMQIFVVFNSDRLSPKKSGARTSLRRFFFLFRQGNLRLHFYFVDLELSPRYLGKNFVSVFSLVEHLRLLDFLFVINYEHSNH